LQSCKTGIKAQKERAGDNRGQQGGRSSRNTQHMIDHSPQLRSAASAASITTGTATIFRKNTNEDSNQISGRSVQAKISVNINPTDDMFHAFTMVQQSLTEFSGAATGTEKSPVITKAVIRLLKNNVNNNS
jgi:hypothetical protein